MTMPGLAPPTSLCGASPCTMLGGGGEDNVPKHGAKGRFYLVGKTAVECHFVFFTWTQSFSIFENWEMAKAFIPNIPKLE